MSINVKKYTKDQMAQMVEDAQEKNAALEAEIDGWVDEPHLVATAWNLLWAIEMELKRPECVDTPWRGK